MATLIGRTCVRRAHCVCTNITARNLLDHTRNFRSIVVKGQSRSAGGYLTDSPRPRCTLYCLSRSLCSQAQTEANRDDVHSIIGDSEKVEGPADRLEFQAETRMLLDIVAKSLYSEQEVFIREIVSNASDAIEKLRYQQLTNTDIRKDVPLEIHIKTDQDAGCFIIQDTGIGMTKEEMVENLGTIARSGSKAFMKDLKEKGVQADSSSSIIGQFGVGFYSTFMVGDKVEVYSQSHLPGNKAYRWISDGTGSFEIAEAENVQPGTKIVVHLKKDCWKYSVENDVQEIIKKYSNFVGVPIYLNGKRINTEQALWMIDSKDVTEQQHEDFYRFLANEQTNPRYILQYKADAPVNIRALFYFPDHTPTVWEFTKEEGNRVSLYSRKVLIQTYADSILPRWLRFVRGIVDSEDIPLNLSRELLQDSALIRKLRSVLTGRIVKFLQDQAKKDRVKYDKFINDYGLFFREGIVTSPEQSEKEEIAKLLRYESSTQPAGHKVGLLDYIKRMEAGQRNIYYLCAPSRQLAESSPYFEAAKKKNYEVLFCYDEYDELSLLQLREFDKKIVTSVENEIMATSDKETSTEAVEGEGKLSVIETDSLTEYLKSALGKKVAQIKVSKRLDNHPAMVTVLEMGAARHFLKNALKGRSEEEKLQVLQPTLEINTSHPIITKLFELKTSDPMLARLVAEQVYDNAMIAAGLMDDPRSMLNRLNDLMSRSLSKH
ncbi:heat shock protein 75 kDa, mitochondrial-like [Ptychodera flava]|uniref:heat shock protein 75 kDa, mitochondrial-like n=1 Tax=Ptychodera flava TaxID=63121 RepID=UPI003969FD06